MTVKPHGKKNRYIALVAVLLVVIGVLTFLLIRAYSGNEIGTETERDPNATAGQYQGKTPEEIQAELDRIVEEGMFNISINSTVVMNKGSDAAEFRIENIAANHHLMSVEIMLDDSGEVIYTSGLIEPGYYIQAAPLKVTLAKGVYAATAVFTAYTLETEAVAGRAAAKITITVQH